MAGLFVNAIASDRYRQVVEVADDALAIASLGRLLTQLADPATGAHVHAFRDTKSFPYHDGWRGRC